MTEEEVKNKKKANWEKRVFWFNIIAQIIIFIVILKSGEVYETAYKFAHVFLIFTLINIHQLVKGSNYWEDMYTELLDQQIEYDNEKTKLNEWLKNKEVN